MIFKSRNKLNIIMINESLILVRFTFATNSHFIDIITVKFLTRYYIGLKYIVTDVRRAPFLVQKSFPRSLVSRVWFALQMHFSYRALLRICTRRTHTNYLKCTKTGNSSYAHFWCRFGVIICTKSESKQIQSKIGPYSVNFFVNQWFVSHSLMDPTYTVSYGPYDLIFQPSIWCALGGFSDGCFELSSLVDD